MIDCVCYVLIPSAIEKAFLLICETLKKSGASLLNPESKKVMTWSDTGDKVEFVEANIMHDVISGHVKNDYAIVPKPGAVPNLFV